MNLKELAQHLGLSQTTVSRALNGFPEVGEHTRQRVKAAADRFHYRPNASARRLATGRANAIGIVFGSESSLLLNPIFTEFLAGVAEHCAHTETDVLVSATEGDEVAAYRRLVRKRLVDAVIVSGTRMQDARVPMLQRLKLPFVVHGRTESSSPVAMLDIDNRAAFRSATDMLIELGHRRVGLVNGEAIHSFAADREGGWRDALAQRGLVADPVLAMGAPMTEENGYRLTRRLLEDERPPTALLCSSIMLALGALRALRDADRAVATDMSLIAHDDGLTAIRPETLSPPLTTTTSSVRRAGRRVAEMALALGDGADIRSLQEVWPVELIARASTGPTPAR